MTARVEPSLTSRVAALEAKARDHPARVRMLRTRSDADEGAGVIEVIRSPASRANLVEEAAALSSPRPGSPRTEVAKNREMENEEPLEMLKERDAIRSKAFLKATIRFQNRNVTMDCVVRNLSLGGARLDISQTFALPAEFELEIPQRGVVFQCTLKWRNGHAAGVKFRDSESPATTLSTRSAATPDELQQENTGLRREVARLGARLREIDGSTA
jgi:hypothetical protein